MKAFADPLEKCLKYIWYIPLITLDTQRTWMQCKWHLLYLRVCQSFHRYSVVYPHTCRCVTEKHIDSGHQNLPRICSKQGAQLKKQRQNVHSATLLWCKLLVGIYLSKNIEVVYADDTKLEFVIKNVWLLKC